MTLFHFGAAGSCRIANSLHDTVALKPAQLAGMWPLYIVIVCTAEKKQVYSLNHHSFCRSVLHLLTKNIKMGSVYRKKVFVLNHLKLTLLESKLKPVWHILEEKQLENGLLGLINFPDRKSVV